MEIRNEYKNPPIPAGYRHIKGEWDTGFVIGQCRDARFDSVSEFVWIPVCVLAADGTLNGSEYNVQFGARDYGYSGQPSRKVPEELQKQAESVEKYGGFYISRYPMSMDDDGRLCSVAGNVPYTMINRVSAKKAAEQFECGSDAVAHLPYAAEQDSVLAWLLRSGQLTDAELRRAVSMRDARYPQRRPVAETGRQGQEKNGLFDVISNVDEWTQEQYDEAFLNGCGQRCIYPKTARCYNRPYACYKYYGFRVALCLA